MPREKLGSESLGFAQILHGYHCSAESLSGKRCVRDSWLLMPLTLATAVGLLGAETGRRAVCAVVGWFARVPASVGAMGAVMVVRGDPHASVPTLVLVLVASGAF